MARKRPWTAPPASAAEECSQLSSGLSSCSHSWFASSELKIQERRGMSGGHHQQACGVTRRETSDGPPPPFLLHLKRIGREMRAGRCEDHVHYQAIHPYQQP